jgi:hypothetical protein
MNARLGGTAKSKPPSNDVERLFEVKGNFAVVTEVGKHVKLS